MTDKLNGGAKSRKASCKVKGNVDENSADDEEYMEVGDAKANMGKGPTENGVRLAVFIARVSADERAKVVVLDLFLIAVDRKDEMSLSL